ncbi:MAG: tRNA (guanosine(46)-N7)-methyltransferase TrmB [Deltaproteobacteria bacterium]|jgi:tRNA (guanine-N7-)-methyltransferase
MSRRIRKHANPFNVQTVVGQLDRMATFGREAPIEVDIGCGEGGFLFERAANHPDVDFVGFEVRKPLVEMANAKVQEAGVTNLVYLYANANVNLHFVAPGVVRRFFVQFPDPCFKKRHQKRRILQPQLVRDMAELLPIGGEVYAQSDVKPLAEEMYVFLAQDDAFDSKLGEDLLVPRPIPELTEWERHHDREAEPVYRMLFTKVREPSGDVQKPEFRDTDPKRLAELEASGG